MGLDKGKIMENKKPKEFAIIVQDGSLPPLVMNTVSEADAVVDMIKRSNKPEVIHVIEKSAYDELKNQIDVLIPVVRTLAADEQKYNWARIATNTLKHLRLE